MSSAGETRRLFRESSEDPWVINSGSPGDTFMACGTYKIAFRKLVGTRKVKQFQSFSFHRSLKEGGIKGLGLCPSLLVCSQQKRWRGSVAWISQGYRYWGLQEGL